MYMTPRRVSGAAVLVASLWAAVAAAQNTPQGTVQIPAGGAPTFPGGKDPYIPDRIQPLPAEKPLFSNFVLQLDQSFYRANSKLENLPSKQRFNQTDVTLGFSIGERGFAAISGGFGNQDISSFLSATPPLTFAIDGDISTRNLMAVAGYYVLPWLSVGAVGGINRQTGPYQFAIPVPPNETDGSGTMYSYFANASVPYGNWTLGLGAAYTKSMQTLKYTNNVPPQQSSEFKLGSLTASASYQLNRTWRAFGSLTGNHTFSQTAFSFEPGLDTNWLTATLGAGMRVADHWEFTLTGVTWLANSQTQYNRVNLGVGYRF